MKILLADTDSETIEEVSQILSKNQPDWQISKTNSGKRCLDIIKSDTCIDLVILGIQLSDMSGFELIGHIRDDSCIPVIFLSREKNINTLVSAFNTGANDYIVVPFNKELFIAKLKAIFRRRTWDIQAKEERQRI